MKLDRVFWRWFGLGLVVAGFLVWAQANATGGLAGLLQVGETSNLRPLIEDQLGTVPLAAGPGHDGQIFYAMGIDLSGDEVGPLLDHAAYRYRRILLPLVASFGGLLDGWALLYSMITLNVVAFAFTAGLLGAWASGREGRAYLLPLAVLLNPGAWLSLQLLTSDVLSIGLMVAALWAFVAPGRSSTLFALSGLAKDVSLATPIPLGIDLDRRRWKIALIPILAVIGWMTFLNATLGDGFASRGNLDWPFAGIVSAFSNWSNLNATELVYLAFALISVAVGVWYSFKRSWLRLPIAAWTLLGLISSNWVWDFGNNAARAFAPIVILVAIASAQPEVATASPRAVSAGAR